ncbi:MAG: glycoside hydrolase family 16 protein, partial [Chromatiales bacterium]
MQLKKHARCYRAILVAIMAIFLTNCGGGGSSDPDIVDKTPGTLREYVQVWSDEFDSADTRSLGLDLDNWNIETGYGPDNDGWGNDESQLYTNSPDNLRVENGNLIITARCDSGICGVRDGSITSARITTKDKFEFRYGKAEARIRVPEGKGTWPAFWMLGANFPDTPWPFSGEIDIMEVFQGASSDINTTHSTIHYFKDEAGEYTFTGDSRTFDFPL